MLIQLFTWYCGAVEALVPSAKMRPFTFISDKKQVTEEVMSVEVDDIDAFMKENKLKAIILYAPTDSFPYYTIALNEKNGTRFGQK